MKGKKITSLLVITVLLLTTLAIATQVNATENIILTQNGDGSAVWSTSLAYTGQYSVKLDTGISGAGRGSIRIPIEPMLLSALTDDPSYWVNEPTVLSGGSYPVVSGFHHPWGHPYMNLVLDLDGDLLTVDKDWLEGIGSSDGPASGGVAVDPPAGVWTEMTVGWGYYDGGDTIIGGDFGGSDPITGEFRVHTLAEWKTAMATAYPDAKVVEVQICYGLWPALPYSPVYVDDMTINGVTYDFDELLYAPVEETVTGSDTLDFTIAETEVDYVGAVDLTITVELLAEEEVEEATFSAVGKYVDVKIDDPDAVDDLYVIIYYDDTGMTDDEEENLIMYWYDGTDWLPCSDSWNNDGANYVEVWIDEFTSPSLADLTGTPFGPGGGLTTDSEYYRTGDIVTVTVGDYEEEGMGTISFWAYNDRTYQEFVVGAFEIDDTGIFVGTFLLVDGTPGTGEMLVRDGDIIEVYYSDGVWFDEYIYIDNMSPEFGALLPLNDTIILDTLPTISAEYDDPLTGDDDTASGIDVDSVVITFDGVDVTENENTTITDSLVTYEVGNVLTDGVYIVTVDVSDMMGNPAVTASWFFMLDSVAPVLEDVSATPAVVYPDEEATIVFTATATDATSGIESVVIDLVGVGGVLTMLDDGVYPDLVAADDVYTVNLTTTGIGAGNYDFEVTAEDEAGFETMVSVSFVSSTDLEAPVIKDLEVEYPVGVVSARVGDLVVISANVTDNVLMASVSVSNGTIGTFDMLDDGLLQDEAADDKVYTASFPIPVCDPDSYNMTITALDDKGNDATETFMLEVTEKLTGYNIELDEGWNLFSMPLIPDAPSVTVVLADILTDVESVWAYDAATGWSSYAPGAPSDLTVMVDGKGYWINMDAAATLSVNGIELPEPPTMPPEYDLFVGWNLMGYKGITTTSANDYLGSAIDDCERIRAFYEGSYHNVVFGNVDEMVPGRGYWIAMSEEGTIYP